MGVRRCLHLADNRHAGSRRSPLTHGFSNAPSCNLLRPTGRLHIDLALRVGHGCTTTPGLLGALDPGSPGCALAVQARSIQRCPSRCLTTRCCWGVKRILWTTTKRESVLCSGGFCSSDYWPCRRQAPAHRGCGERACDSIAHTSCGASKTPPVSTGRIRALSSPWTPRRSADQPVRGVLTRSHAPAEIRGPGHYGLRAIGAPAAAIPSKLFGRRCSRVLISGLSEPTRCGEPSQSSVTSSPSTVPGVDSQVQPHAAYLSSGRPVRGRQPSKAR